MITHTTQIRVRYEEVDQMGFLYHAHYVTYFDVARTELIRELGVPNRMVEENGIMIPVMNVTVNYIMPANYDDLLTIRTSIKEFPGATATFYYEVFREDTLLTTGSVTVAFMHADTKRACRPPKMLIDAVRPYF